MDEAPFRFDAESAAQAWQILVRRLEADPAYEEAVLSGLLSGSTPLPFRSLAGDQPGVELLESWPPRLKVSADALDEHARFQAQSWAALELVALYGVTTEGYDGHAFPLHAGFSNHRVHCLQCGVGIEHWSERERDRPCPNPAPSARLGGHRFPMEDVIHWRKGHCAACDLDYDDWRRQGCPPCVLAPHRGGPRSRPSGLSRPG